MKRSLIPQKMLVRIVPLKWWFPSQKIAAFVFNRRQVFRSFRYAYFLVRREWETKLIWKSEYTLNLWLFLLFFFWAFLLFHPKILNCKFISISIQNFVFLSLPMKHGYNTDTDTSISLIIWENHIIQCNYVSVSHQCRRHRDTSNPKSVHASYVPAKNCIF